MVPIIGVFVVEGAVHAGILPEPEVPMPIFAFEFVHVKEAPDGVLVILGIDI